MKWYHWMALGLVVVADHMWMVEKIEQAKREAIDEAGDLDRDDVKPSCLVN
jgi:hypothetical protein